MYRPRSMASDTAIAGDKAWRVEGKGRWEAGDDGAEGLASVVVGAGGVSENCRAAGRLTRHCSN